MNLTNLEVQPPKYEVHGCREEEHLGGIEQVDDDEAEFWTVYERDDAGELHALEDHPTRAAAEAAMKKLQENAT